MRIADSITLTITPLTLFALLTGCATSGQNEVLPTPSIVLRSSPIVQERPTSIETAVKTKHFYDSRLNPEGDFRERHQGRLVKKSNGLRSVIVDTKTGLMWQRSGTAGLSAGHERVMRWYIDKLNRSKFAGHSDWRLPTVEEAMSLMEKEKNGNGLHISPLFDGRQWGIWTSDFLGTRPGVSGQDPEAEIGDQELPGFVTGCPWHVNYETGVCGPLQNSHFLYVRAVRSFSSAE